jgi:hypothetical protein
MPHACYKCVLSCGCTTGLLEDVLSGAKRAYEGLQRSLDNTATAATTQDTGATGIGAVAERVCRAVGAFHACNVAVLCLAAVSVTTAAAGTMQEPTIAVPVPTVEVSCACCGRVATTARMLRCSRCKAVHYCSKEHQQQHWKLHKVRIE